MKFTVTCDKCNGKGVIERELRIGDIVTPCDGSAMPNALHKLLWNGHGRTDLPLLMNEAFKPVRVLAISGEFLGVTPASWTNRDTMMAERFREDIYPAISCLWVGGKQYGEGFWINAKISHLLEFH